jgi:hypothetical protein
MRGEQASGCRQLTLALVFCRRLSLALTTVVMLLSLGTTLALQYMPNDPLHLRRNFTLYSLFVVFASGAGFIGALRVRNKMAYIHRDHANMQPQRNHALLSLFASHLLLDSILYLIPRIILLNFTVSIPALLCSPPAPSTRNDDVYRVHQNPRMAQRFLASKRCKTMSWALECCVVSGSLLLMGLQFWLALKIRRYAQYLERRELQLKMEVEKRLDKDEKHSYRDGL